MKTRKIKLTFLLAGLIAFSTTQVMAQHHCGNSNWSPNADARWWNHNTPAEYALTAEQISEINKLRESSYEKKLPIKNELRSLRKEYQAANPSADLDVDKIKSLRSSIRDKEEKVDSINLETRLRIRKLLNKKQKAYFNNNKYTWWNMAENCWYSGNRELQLHRKRMMSHRRHCW